MKSREELREYNKQWRKDNAERYRELCRESNKTNTRKVRLTRTAENRAFLCAYLSEHPCIDCGESDILVLDFDHLPQFEKRKDISALLNQGYKLKDIKAEMAKCEVVCSNCHRRRTSSRRPCYRWRFLNP